VGLRDTAETDLGLILEDQTTGFGMPITLTNPAETTGSFTGFSNDVSELIDPDTGIAISGRVASVAIRIQPILDAGFVLPVAIADKTSKPWLVGFDDINGNSYTFKVIESNPDRALGLVICKLEAYS